MKLLLFNNYRYENAPTEVTDLTALPIPPPPFTIPKSLENDQKAAMVQRCPICRTKRKNETLVPVSGFVYCYKCIVNHLRSDEGKNSCPVTGLPANEDDLIRIYPPGSE